MTEVDLFISTQRIKVLNADTQVCAPSPAEARLQTSQEAALAVPAAGQVWGKKTRPWGLLIEFHEFL